MGREAKNKNGIPVVIGGMVLDIHSIASTPLSLKTTTPGKNEFIPGGVARNIAECLSKLGTKSFMISALGCDLPGDILLQQWKSTGLPVAGIQQGSNITTASVSNVFDTDGELIAGIASVESIEKHVTPQWIRQFTSNVYSAPLVMVDANLTPEALQASCQMAADLDVPVWFEPVSVAKSKRIASIASHITFASPNEHELIAMANALTREDSFYPIQKDKTGASIEALFKELKPAILVLLQKGIKYVLVTLGPDGAILCSQSGPSCLRECLKNTCFDGKKELFDMVSSRCPAEEYSYSTPYKGGSQLLVIHFPALPALVGRVSGAGDCLVGGVIASLCSGLNIMQSVSVGIASAKAAIEVKYNVPEKYDLADIAANAGNVYNAAKILFLESRL
ncbi:pseudouridine kinase [Silene latifolia]|uniref:pseudouridine kinase n=1 Tax=Silene latifolia TaxID=37657 RepID=UPI003D781DA8